MRILPTIFIAIVSSTLLAACPGAGTENANTNIAVNANVESNANANLAKSDVDEFEMTVKLPFHPQDVIWREETLGKADGRVPGPTDRKLTAVILFNKEDADKIVAQAAAYRPGTPVTMNAESWYPDELAAISQLSADKSFKGMSYAANDFLQPPFTEGKVTRVEDSNFFVLELFTK